MVGTAVELLFLGHFEDAWQVGPLALIAIHRSNAKEN
jgi:hypothetical protein